MNPTPEIASVIPNGTANAPAREAIGYRYAGVPTRLAAFAIDVVMLSALLFTVSAVVAIMFGPTFTLDTGSVTTDGGVLLDARLKLINMLLGVITGGAYFVISWSMFGGSPGQHLLRLRVGDAADGAPLTSSKSFARWILLGAPFWIVSATASGLGGIAAFFAAVIWSLILLATVARSATKQGIHDRYVRSVVVRVARPSSRTEHPPAGRRHVR